MMMPDEMENEAAVERCDPGKNQQPERRTIWLWVMIVSVFGILIPPTVGIFGTITSIDNTMELAREAELRDMESITSSLSNSLAPTILGTVISVGFLALFAFSFASWIVSGRVLRKGAHD